MNKVRKLLQNTIMMIIAINVALAFIALFRDIALAAFLGTTAQADALLLAFFIPDILGNNLLAAAIGIACVPIFTEIHIHKNKIQFNQSVKSLTLLLWLACLVLAMVSFFFREAIIEVIGKGLSPQIKEISVNLFTIMLPTLLLYPLITIGSSISNIHNSFRIPAAAPVLFNLVFLGSVIYGIVLKLPKTESVYGIAVSVTAGVVGMVLMIWGNIGRRGWVRIFRREKIKWAREELRAFFKIFLPYIAVLFAYQSVLYVEKYLASFQEPGTIAGLNYAYRISQLPLWIFVAALTTFSFPSIAKLKETRQADELKKSVSRFLKLTLVIVLPLTLTIQILRLPIITILFKGGAFDDHSIRITSGILAGYALAIIGQSIFMISIRFFMALRQMMIPMLIVIFSSTVNILADFILVRSMGAAGLGYGAALGSLCNGVLLIVFLNRKLKLDIRGKIRDLARIALANVPVAVLALLAILWWHSGMMQGSTLLKLTYGVVVFAACAIAYMAGLHYFKVYMLRVKKAEQL